MRKIKSNPKNTKMTKKMLTAIDSPTAPSADAKTTASFKVSNLSMWLQDYSTEDLPRVWRQGHSSNLASPMSSMFPANNTQKEPNISNISTSISTTTPKKISKSSIDWPTGSSKGPLWKEERCSSMPLTCNWQLLLAWDIWSEWLKLPWSKVCSWSWRAKWRSLLTSWNKFKAMTSRKWPLCHFKENDLLAESYLLFVIYKHKMAEN